MSLWCDRRSSCHLVWFWETQLESFRKHSGETCLALHWQIPKSHDNNDNYIYIFIGINGIFFSHQWKKSWWKFIMSKPTFCGRKRDSLSFIVSVFIFFLKWNWWSEDGQWLSEIKREKDKVSEFSFLFLLLLLRTYLPHMEVPRLGSNPSCGWSLHHRHRNTWSKLHLWPMLQFVAMLDP